MYAQPSTKLEAMKGNASVTLRSLLFLSPVLLRCNDTKSNFKSTQTNCIVVNLHSSTRGIAAHLVSLKNAGKSMLYIRLVFFIIIISQHLQ